MTKSQKVGILLVLAILCAATTGIIMYKFCNSTKGFIYLFNDDYKAGTKLTKEMFVSVKVDEEIVKNGQNSSIDNYYITGDNFTKMTQGNDYLLNDVSKDKPLTFTDLALTSGTSIERSLSGENMAVTIPISGTAAVTDELRVGSIVNIYSTDSAETKLIFENMKIIARNDGDSISTVTFETNPDETLDLINAANNMKLYFSLAKPVDDKERHSGYVDTSSSTVETSVETNTEAEKADN